LSGPDKGSMIQAALKGAHQGVKSPLDEFENTFAPYSNARSELVKTVISLSSASVVLTVTFSNSLITTRASVTWRGVLFASWTAFLISTICAIITLWFATKMKTLPRIFPMQSNRVEEALLKLDMDFQKPNFEQEISSTVEKTVADIIAMGVSSIMKYDNWAERSLKISLIMFVVALALLGVFGWKQITA
jgi:hypothetical protein